MKVYSLFDRRLREFGSLVLFKNDEAAERGMLDAFSGQDTLVSKHPGDFDLMCVGAFDQETGLLDSGAMAMALLVVNFAELLGSRIDGEYAKLEV